MDYVPYNMLKFYTRVARVILIECYRGFFFCLYLDLTVLFVNFPTSRKLQAVISSGTMEFCGKASVCGHYCRGIKDEETCLPCLSCSYGNAKQTANDICAICYTDALPAIPSIQLSCGHIFHFECIQNILLARWSGPRISFGFTLCPICKSPVEHPSLKAQLDPIKVLYDDVKTKSLIRLQFAGLSKIEDPVGFAMDRYAYYTCSKCEKAYYGGDGRCEQGNGDDFNPGDLICGGCADVSRLQECPTHGTNYIEFKCRYCCSVAVFYCFGTTHICNSCHNNISVLTSMSRTQLPQCPAGPVGKQLAGNQCPLGLKQHPPTGDEFSLGCGLCNNLKCF